MYPCRCTDSETALRIVSALRWRKVLKSMSANRVSNSRYSCAPSNAALDFSFWYRSFLALHFCMTYVEICSTEKRVCLFKCNVRNGQTIDTERTCLTSQIFGVVDFTKHRMGKRRLHLRHCGSIREYSHGSMFMPSAPQLEQLRAISETIEQKWWERVKYRNSSLTTFGGKIMSAMASSLLLAYYFRENFTSIQTKKKFANMTPEWKTWMSRFLKHAKLYWPAMCCEQKYVEPS